MDCHRKVDVLAWWAAEMSFDLSDTALYIQNPIHSVDMDKTLFSLFLLKMIFGHVAEA